MNFINSLHSEWLKTKKTIASTLTLIGGFFIPLIFLLGFLMRRESINDYSVDIWETHIIKLWENMGPLLLPLSIILISSLISQLEYRNNTWKQLHTTPQTYTTIFFAKFSVIMLMIIKLFIFFIIGTFVSAIIPSLLITEHLPNQTFPITFFIKENIKVFVACLPIIALQYFISLQFKNFIVPIGIGILGLLGSLMGMSWKYIYFSPYSSASLVTLKLNKDSNVYVLAIFYFLVISLIGYISYIRRKDKS